MNNKLNDRESVFDYYELYTKNSKIKLDDVIDNRNLMKSYIFETYNDELTNSLFKEDELLTQNLFKQNSQLITEIDNNLFSISFNRNSIGFIEKINSRFSVIYTLLDAKQSDKLFGNLTKKSTILDSLWLSGPIYDHLLNNLTNSHSGNRYTNIKFDSRPLFELEYSSDSTDDIHDNDTSSSSITQKIGGLQNKIRGIRDFLPMFNSISALRFPSHLGPGGNDIYFNGKVTNRSESFFEHRNQIINLIQDYQSVTETIEDLCWLGMEKIPGNNIDFPSFKAAPTIIKFPTEIHPNLLYIFVERVFRKGAEPFKIIGDIVKINDYRYHIYGTDLHLWQNIFIDISTTNITLYLPYGTCGNTIHRFITNVQKYLVANISVSIGDYKYQDLISKTMGGSK